MSLERNVSPLRFVVAAAMYKTGNKGEQIAAHRPSLPKWVHSWSSCSSTPRSHYPCTPCMRSLRDNNELLTSHSPPLIHLKSLFPSTPLESDSERLLVWCFAGAAGAGCGGGGAHLTELRWDTGGSGVFVMQKTTFTISYF